MNFWLAYVLAALLTAGVEISDTTSHQPAEQQATGGSSTAPISSASETSRSDATASASSGKQDGGGARKPLQPESRLLLVRYVSGEFAKAIKALPGGKRGLKIPVGKPLDPQHLSDMLRLYGTAVPAGDRVQITSLEFHSQEIVFRINGGGKKPFRLRDHLQVGVGVGEVAVTPPPSQASAPVGATLILDYGRPLPDMSPDDLKRDLSVVLDFSKQHSAAVDWIETLPPEFRQAIQDRKAVVGMDREMVLAALGRPDRKVRTRDPEGQETEDWIYGAPPEKTTFVTFLGDNVVRVKEFD